MKKLMTILTALSLLAACRGKAERNDDGIIGNDTTIKVSNSPIITAPPMTHEDSNLRANKISDTSGGHGQRTHKGTREDSIKTLAHPLYKGDNSDTGKLKK